MLFDLPSLIIIWTALSIFVAAVGAFIGWVAATAVNGNKKLVWIGAALSPVSWAIVYGVWQWRQDEKGSCQWQAMANRWRVATCSCWFAGSCARSVFNESDRSQHEAHACAHEGHSPEHVGAGQQRD